MKHKQPKILLFDIETAPILGSVWSLFDQDIALNQIERDWFILSFSAKWLGEKKVIYKDQRAEKDVENDSKLLKEIWKLLDECDVVITQNGNKFDIKKLNARFILNGMKPPSSYRKIDTLLIARKSFAFTSNKLEYMTDKLCTKYKKLVDKKFPGFTLWKECIKGNQKAWKEMERYNKLDVLSLEELYLKLAPWAEGLPNFNAYNDSTDCLCSCGSKVLNKNGFCYTSLGRYQRYSCGSCGKEAKGRTNLLSKEKRQSLKKI